MLHSPWISPSDRHIEWINLFLRRCLQVLLQSSSIFQHFIMPIWLWLQSYNDFCLGRILHLVQVIFATSLRMRDCSSEFLGLSCISQLQFWLCWHCTTSSLWGSLSKYSLNVMALLVSSLFTCGFFSARPLVYGPTSSTWKSFGGGENLRWVDYTNWSSSAS